MKKLLLFSMLVDEETIIVFHAGYSPSADHVGTG